MTARCWLGLAASLVAVGTLGAQLPEETVSPPKDEVVQAPVIPPAGEKPFEAPLPKAPYGSGVEPWSEGGACCPDTGCCEPQICGLPGCFWVRAEYLLWWTRGQAFPPLVTSAPIGTPLATAGLLGAPTTTVLFGGEREDADARSGGRFTLGFWLNRCHTIGIQASYFQLETETENFSVNSGQNPIIILPFIDENGNQRRRVTAYPGFSTGSVAINTSSRLYGGDIHLLFNLCCGCNYRIDALVGYRTLRLNEDTGFSDTEIDTLGRRIDITDRFSTRNRFNGGDLGLTAMCWHCRWTFDVTARVALGCNEREVSVDGSSVFRVPGFPTTVRPGGFFALPTNIGSRSDTEFGAIPELSFNLGYQFTKCLRGTIGYTFIWWPDVARSGEQIDTTVNLTQLPSLFTSGGPLVGAARPASQIRESDYWAHGLSFGLEFRY